MSVPASRTPSHASGTGSVSGAAPRLRRPTEFRLLDGRRVLVALPEDVHHLRSKYASPGAAAAADNAGGRKASNSSGSSDMAAAGDASPPVAAPAGMQVEVVVHGSAEHEALLREALAQHQARREHLRATHGDELLDEWDSVGRQLDAASAMLSELEARGGAGSGEGNNLSSDIEDRLKHNFGRFGYTANIMVRDDSGGASGSRTPATSGNGISRAGSVTADPEKPSGAISTAESGGRGEFMDKSAGTTMKLFKRPVVKQYFHKGLLWRFSEETKVMSFELFFDLLYGEYRCSYFRVRERR